MQICEMNLLPLRICLEVNVVDDKIYKYIRYVVDANKELHVKKVNAPIPEEQKPTINSRLQFGDTIYVIKNVVDFDDHIVVYTRVDGIIHKTGGDERVVPIYKNRRIGLVSRENYSVN